MSSSVTLPTPFSAAPMPCSPSSTTSSICRPSKPRSCVLPMIHPSADAKKVALLSQIGDDLPEMLVGDSIRLRQVLLNLLGNAVKFTEQGSVRLELTAQPLDDHRLRLDFAVHDTGIGMTPEVVQSL